MDLSKSYEFFQPDKVDGRVHLIGCGAVGSTIAEMLVRAGITKIDLYDFDTVEPHNIGNQKYRQQDINRPKVEALRDIMLEINPDAEPFIKLHPEGYTGQRLSGYVFLCLDNIDTRREITKANRMNRYIKAVFDVRLRLTDAQHYAADWSDEAMINNLINSMNFTHEEALAETPRTACNLTLSIAPTVCDICCKAVSNFMNFILGGELKKMILADSFSFDLQAY